MLESIYSKTEIQFFIFFPIILCKIFVSIFQCKHHLVPGRGHHSPSVQEPGGAGGEGRLRAGDSWEHRMGRSLQGEMLRVMAAEALPFGKASVISVLKFWVHLLGDSKQD